MPSVSFSSAVWLHRVAAVLLALVLAGCAGTEPMGGSETELWDRAQAYWDARVVNDLVTAFEFEAASVDAEPGLLQRYVSRGGGIRYRSAAVTAVRPVAVDRAEVDVAVVYTLAFPGFRRPIEAEITSNWIVLDGRWYHEREGRE